ncbi:MAG: hypothetical protein Q4C58_01140 [Eubacteriales bacterium]|nr:hypothetical protein [Eubacteriales bacterium]
MKKLNTILNIIMGTCVGVFIGHGIYIVWDFKTHPELYAMQSAPWYTSILIYGVFTIIVLLICVAIKIIINHISKQRNLKKLSQPI